MDLTQTRGRNDMTDPDQDRGTTAAPGKAYEPKGGEDEGSTEHEGSDDHLHEDQKPTKQ